MAGRGLERSWGRLADNAGAVVPTYNDILEARGGVLIAVHGDYYKIKQSFFGDNTVTSCLEATTTPVEWWITVVYGPQEDNAKIEFLNEIKQIKTSVSEKWLLIGDFNMILQA